MTTKLTQELNRHLAGYLVQVETWSFDDGDTFLMRNAREWLAKHYADLSADQLRKLLVADQQVLHLLVQDYPQQTDDVLMLRFVADIINGKAEQKVA